MIAVTVVYAQIQYIMIAFTVIYLGTLHSWLQLHVFEYIVIVFTVVCG